MRGFRSGTRCSLYEQLHYGVVKCALGWACWKTYVGRPEENGPRRLAINQLGNGLSGVYHNEDALNVKEADLSMERRLGAPERDILITQGSLASTYQQLGQVEKSLLIRRDVYSGNLKLN